MFNLTLCMIVKNEAPNIIRCLESVAPYIDYYIICDTGSTDDTKAIIKDFFNSKFISGEIHDHKWVDFGTNRSQALKLCFGKTRWALMIDADDNIEGKLPIQQLDRNVDGYNVKTVHGSIKGYRPQIFNVEKKKWFYIEPLHEYPWAEGGVVLQNLEGDYYWNLRSDGGRLRDFSDGIEKYKSDLNLLKGYLDENPNDPRKTFYAGQSAFDANLFKTAEEYYLKRTHLGSYHEEIFYSWYRIGQCREKLFKSPNEVIDAYMLAYEVGPHRAESLYNLSVFYRRIQRPRNAFVVANTAIKIPLSPNALFVEAWIYNWGIPDEIGTTAYYCPGFAEKGAKACIRLLSGPYLPPEHKARVENNLKTYLTDFPDLRKILKSQLNVEKI